ncbi:MAG: Lrp/AsnC family transcriptional regulator [Anaerorhabdus sp.]
MDDLKLLDALKADPRISTVDLADILNESEEEVIKSKERLEKEKIICGYHTVIHWDKTNRDHCTAIIEVGAKPERDLGYDKVAQALARFPEVSSVYLVSGKSEFLVTINGRTMREVADFVGQKLAPIEGVEHTVTCFVLRAYKLEGVHLTETEEKNERLLVTP